MLRTRDGPGKIRSRDLNAPLGGASQSHVLWAWSITLANGQSRCFRMFVADNGIDWAISVAPDPRIPVLHAELRRIPGSAFEVVASPR